MLFTESQLASRENGLSILDEAAWLTEEEAARHVDTVPVRELSRFGEGVTMVRFDDIAALAEDYGASYLDAMAAVAEASQVDPSLMTVAVDEADIIEDPELVTMLENVVVTPISEEDPVFQFCEACVDALAETGDEEGFQEAVLNEKSFGEDDGRRFGPINSIKDFGWSVKHHAKNVKDNGLKGVANSIKGMAKRNPVGVGNAIASNTVPGLGLPLYLYGKADSVAIMYKRFKDRPRNVIARKIASLRKLYAKWLYRAKIERDDKTSSLIKRVCTNIMALIDKLLLAMQKGANKLG